MDVNKVSEVELLRRQYLQMIDPDELNFSPPELLRLPETQNLIYSTMFVESGLTYLPPKRYRFRVLKRLFNAMENANEDPEEDVCFPRLSVYTSTGKQAYPLLFPAGFRL